MTDDSDAAVRAYVAEVLGRDAEIVGAVSRFSGGNGHAVYRVSYAAMGGEPADVVVRVSLDDSAAARERMEREVHALDAVGGVVAPRLYDVRRDGPWFAAPCMCMEFIRGSARDLGSSSVEDVRQLGSVVAALHERTDADPALRFETSDDIASYAAARLASILSARRWVRDPLPAALRDRLDSAADAMQARWAVLQHTDAFRSGEPLALLHGDVAPGSVLWRAGPVLIDWEYSRLGDSADEIGYLFEQNGLTSRQREAFWAGYCDRTSSGGRAGIVADRVAWWEQLTLFGSALWWVERWVRRTEADMHDKLDPGVPREPGYYFSHVVRRVDRLEELLARSAA